MGVASAVMNITKQYLLNTLISDAMHARISNGFYGIARKEI